MENSDWIILDDKHQKNNNDDIPKNVENKGTYPPKKKDSIENLDIDIDTQNDNLEIVIESKKPEFKFNDLKYSKNKKLPSSWHFSDIFNKNITSYLAHLRYYTPLLTKIFLVSGIISFMCVNYYLTYSNKCKYITNS